MLKNTFTIVALLAIFTISAFNFKDQVSEQELIGTWNWDSVINTESNEKSGIDMLTMGMATEVKTEFLKDSVMNEYKNKLNEEGLSKKPGKWYVDNNMLYMKPKSKWMSVPIISISKDTLIVEFRKPIQLVMVREK